jgi:tetraacyldisaccharide-1-P 4'-kinase
MIRHSANNALQAILQGRGPCDVIATDDGLWVRERGKDRGEFVPFSQQKEKGSATMPTGSAKEGR